MIYMGQITLANDNNSVSIEYADEQESVIWNSSVATTIGGVPKQQADSSRLKIMLTCYLNLSDVPDFNTVIEDWTEELTYTPSRTLYGKSSAADMQVVIVKTPKVKTYGYNGEIIYEVQLELEEVISS